MVSSLEDAETEAKGDVESLQNSCPLTYVRDWTRDEKVPLQLLQEKLQPAAAHCLYFIVS